MVDKYILVEIKIVTQYTIHNKGNIVQKLLQLFASLPTTYTITINNLTSLDLVTV